MNTNEEIIELPEDKQGSVYFFGEDKILYDSIYHTTVPEVFHQKVKESILREDLNYYLHEELAGDIEKEFLLFDKDLKNEHYNILNIEKQTASNICTFIQDKLKFLKINAHVNKLWINFQKPGELNPMHNHSDDYSFIWYIDIPEVIRNEHLRSLGNKKCRGLVGFINKISFCEVRINPKSRDLLIFNSSKPHCVYPFYSDAVRISMAGNIREIEWQ